MSKKWEATHTAADGTPLMLEDGKLYSQWSWDNFGPAYYGDATQIGWYQNMVIYTDHVEASPLDFDKPLPPQFAYGLKAWIPMPDDKEDTEDEEIISFNLRDEPTKYKVEFGVNDCCRVTFLDTMDYEDFHVSLLDRYVKHLGPTDTTGVVSYIASVLERHDARADEFTAAHLLADWRHAENK